MSLEDEQIMFSKIVRNVRMKSRLSQRDFAVKLDVCHQLISQYEIGYRKRPDIEVAKRLISIAKELNVPLTMDEIYDDSPFGS